MGTLARSHFDVFQIRGFGWHWYLVRSTIREGKGELSRIPSTEEEGKAITSSSPSILISRAQEQMREVEEHPAKRYTYYVLPLLQHKECSAFFWKKGVGWGKERRDLANILNICLVVTVGFALVGNEKEVHSILRIVLLERPSSSRGKSVRVPLA